MDLRMIARSLGGDICGRQVLAPGPNHSPKDRSLSVRLSAQAPDGFLTYSHAGDPWRDCREHVRRKLGLPEWVPGDERHQERNIPAAHVPRWDFETVDAEATADIPWSSDDWRRISIARQCFLSGEDPRRPEVLSYLAARRLRLPDGVAGNVLRYHPACVWRNEDTGQIDRVPCLVAGFTSIDHKMVTGVHRIRLDQPKRWPKTQRLMLGIVRRAAVQLGQPDDGLLAVGEGVETCMAAMQLGLGPAWALGSVGMISAFPVIGGIRKLIILGETGSASARAVDICRRRWQRAGREVVVDVPEVGSDHNDLLMARASR